MCVCSCAVPRPASSRNFLLPALTAPGVGALCSDVTYRLRAPAAHESWLLRKLKGGRGVNGEEGWKVENRSLSLSLSLFRKSSNCVKRKGWVVSEKLETGSNASAVLYDVLNAFLTNWNLVFKDVMDFVSFIAEAEYCITHEVVYYCFEINYVSCVIFNSWLHRTR